MSRINQARRSSRSRNTLPFGVDFIQTSTKTAATNTIVVTNQSCLKKSETERRIRAESGGLLTPNCLKNVSRCGSTNVAIKTTTPIAAQAITAGYASADLSRW